jgi:cell division control protein 11
VVLACMLLPPWPVLSLGENRRLTFHSHSDSSMNPEDLASQSVRLKEEQLRREEEKLREIEVKVQREINEKRQELLARESQLREIEARMQREAAAAASAQSPTIPEANGEADGN